MEILSLQTTSKWPSQYWNPELPKSWAFFFYFLFWNELNIQESCKIDTKNCVLFVQITSRSLLATWAHGFHQHAMEFRESIKWTQYWCLLHRALPKPNEFTDVKNKAQMNGCLEAEQDLWPTLEPSFWGQSKEVIRSSRVKGSGPWKGLQGEWPLRSVFKDPAIQDQAKPQFPCSAPLPSPRERAGFEKSLKDIS